MRSHQPAHGPWGHRGRQWTHHETDRAALRDIFESFRERVAVGRGDVRQAILAVLQQGPMHGYQVIQELEVRSGGRWRPSAGSVYPTLQQLSDEGLIRGEEVDGRRTFTLTDAGREAAAAGPAEMPWETASPRDSGNPWRVAREVMSAWSQVNRVGSPKAIEEARDILVDARKRLYRLLADEEPETAAK
jgi:Transcriptional regulator PadR-like family